MVNDTEHKEKEHDEQLERSRKELPFHKRFALFLGGISALTTALFLFTDTANQAQLIGFSVLIVVAIISYFFGGKL